MTTTNNTVLPSSVRIALQICDDLQVMYARNREDIAALCELSQAFDDIGNEAAAQEAVDEVWRLRLVNQGIEKAFFAAAKLT